MRYKILCSECGEVLGSLEKDKLEQTDIDLYKVSALCSKEHLEKVELVQDLETK